MVIFLQILQLATVKVAAGMRPGRIGGEVRAVRGSLSLGRGQGSSFGLSALRL